MIRHVRFVIEQTVRLLCFRGLQTTSRAEALLLIAAGILFSWIAGLGRYWDHPSAESWQYAGLGSVAYIFVLSFLIWMIGLPLKKMRWSYSSVLIFVALTSPLAWLYAIPVERFMPMELAIDLNVLFLAIVAIWRVALYVTFLRYFAGMSGMTIAVMITFPLALIVFSLVTLNLENAVFEIMAGLEPERREGAEEIHDAVYRSVALLALIAVPAFFATAFIYICLVADRAFAFFLKD